MTSNKLLIPLFGSLAVNLFLLGVLAVPLFHGRANFRGRPPHPSPYEKHGRLDGHPPGEEIRRKDERAGPPMEADTGEQRLLRELVELLGGPADARVRPILEKNRDERKSQKRTILEARRDAGRALTNIPFSEQELETKLSAIADAENQRKLAAHRTVLALALLLTDAERAKLKASFPSLESPPR